jgi:Arc/MetJ-type ribon-helix-helix transcriptional regulator
MPDSRRLNADGEGLRFPGAGMKTIQVECPDQLADRLGQLVRDGWVADEQQAVVEALRRFLDSRRPELIESQVLADVKWGLHGGDCPASLTR